MMQTLNQLKLTLMKMTGKIGTFLKKDGLITTKEMMLLLIIMKLKLSNGLTTSSLRKLMLTIKNQVKFKAMLITMNLKSLKNDLLSIYLQLNFF